VTLLVTGGSGFVLSNLVRLWLERERDARVLVVDASPPDALARRFFSGVADRLTHVEADVAALAPGDWARLASGHSIEHIVHGATVTPHAFVDETGRRHEPEREAPARVLEVNVMGTVRILEWARRLPALERFVTVSSGSVYGDHGPEPAGTPLPEDGYVEPRSLYAVSKYAAELVTRRYGELYALPAVSVRLSSVYGPMDRVTSARHVRSAPYLLAHLALAGETIRVNAPEALGDWIHAGDVAEAIAALLRAHDPLRYPVYNVAYGEAVELGTLIERIRERVPALRCEVVPEAEANVVGDPNRRAGAWGAYDISRLRDELGWRPAPLRRRLHEYLDWLRRYELAG